MNFCGTWVNLELGRLLDAGAPFGEPHGVWSA